MKKVKLAFAIILGSVCFPIYSQTVPEDLEDVICTVTTDKELYTLGENVEITVSLSNTGIDVVSIDLTGCLFNYGIDFNYDNNSYLGMCPTLLFPIELNPGESFGFPSTHTSDQYYLGLGEHTIYGNSESTPAFYSDFHFISVVEEFPGIPLFTETFETYFPNQQLCGQNDTLWKPWSGLPGTTMDPFVRNTNARSGSNSLLIEGVNDAVLLIDNKTSGRYSASFYIFVPEGFTAYFNLLSGYSGAMQPSINGQVFFDLAGQGKIDAGTPNAATFLYPYNQWIFLENIVDIESDSAWIKVDGVQLAAWKWSKGTGITNLWTVRQWAGIDFYAWNSTGTPKYYVDDINFEMIETPASASITPYSLHFFNPDSLTQSFTIENTGQSPLSFQINPVFFSFPPIPMFTLTDNQLPINLVSNENMLENDKVLPKEEHDLILISEDKSTTNILDEGRENAMVHYDGENVGRLGFSTASTQQIAVRFPYNRLGEHKRRKLETVRIFIRDLPANTSVLLCQGDYYGADIPGDTICYKSFVPIANQWNTINIDSLFYIGNEWNDQQIWVIYKFTQIATGRSIGFDNGPSNPDGSWYLSGTTWKPFYTLFPNYCFNWNIRLELSGNPVWNWLEMGNTSGVIEPNSTQEISITAKTDSTWNYPTELCFHTSDPTNQTIYRNVYRTICDSTTIQLETGWNLISTVLNPLPKLPEIVFEDAINNNALEIVTGFENQQGVYFDPDGTPFLNTLTNIYSSKGYWVKVNQDTEIMFYGNPNDNLWWPPFPYVILSTGWNLVGCRYYDSPWTPEDAFANLIMDSTLVVVTSYDEEGLYFNPTGQPFLNTLTEVKNGSGYWVKVSADCNWWPYQIPWFSKK